MYFNFMAAVNICSDFGAQKIKLATVLFLLVLSCLVVRFGLSMYFILFVEPLDERETGVWKS